MTKEGTTANSTCKKLAVQWLNEPLCFVSSFVVANLSIFSTILVATFSGSSISICSLLLASTFMTSCNGQTKKPSQTDIIAEPKSILFVQPKLIKTQGSSESDNVRCGLQDKNGNLWFGTTGEGVYRYDGKSITSSKPNGDGWIRYIKEDKKGNLWFGGRNHGNFVYDGKTFTNHSEKFGIGNPILVDKKGNIWFNGEEKLSTVESEGGIWCYDGQSLKNYNTSSGMSKYFVCFMLEDKNENIWIGTRNTGLCQFDGKSFTNFSE